MRFEKPSLTIDDQIALLERRGMLIPERAKAQHCLRHISYYRLRAYWFTFEAQSDVDGDHLFAPGTSLEDAVTLYIFDRRLRLLVMDAIERFEVSLRGNWAYHLAMQYGSHGYLNSTLYRDANIYAENHAQLMKEVARSTDAFMVHYKRKYTQPSSPPVWMTAEVMALGTLSKWYSSLLHRPDRNAIAKPYGLDERILSSAAHHIAYVRNICAHHGRLWNKYLTVGMVSPNSPGSIKLALAGAADRRIYSTLVMLTYLLRIAAPGSDWQRSLVELIVACPLANTQQMGFPADWKSHAFWQPALKALEAKNDVSS